MAIQPLKKLHSHEFESHGFNSNLLPNEIMLLIFDQLPFKYLKTASLVSRKWNELININFELKLYHKLAKTVIPLDNGYCNINIDEALIIKKIFAVNFNGKFGQDLKIVHKLVMKNPLVLSFQEGIDHSLTTSSEQLRQCFKDADFTVQEHYVLRKMNTECTTWINGVTTTIINPRLSPRQLKLIKELEQESPNLLKERQEKKEIEEDSISSAISTVTPSFAI